MVHFKLAISQAEIDLLFGDVNRRHVVKVLRNLGAPDPKQHLGFNDARAQRHGARAVGSARCAEGRVIPRLATSRLATCWDYRRAGNMLRLVWCEESAQPMSCLAC